MQPVVKFPRNKPRYRLCSLYWFRLVKHVKTNSRLLFKSASIAFFIGTGYTLFHNTIEAVFEIRVVNPLLSEVRRSLFLDILFVVGAGITIVWGVYFCKKRIVVAHYKWITLLSLALVTAYYRFLGDRWEFTAFKTWDVIKYSDFIFLITGVYVAVAVLSRRRKPIKSLHKNEGFLLDTEVRRSTDDKLQYEHYAEKIAAKIMATGNTSALAIAVTGVWGSGKTSFINFITQKLQSEKNSSESVVVKFNPWQSLTPQAIIQDFFDALQERLNQYHPKISRKLLKYAQRLGESVIATKGIGAMFGVMHEESTVRQYESINRILQNIDIKIVVVIDDLDRLDKKELIEVLRLIRNTANFSNMVFIAAYDRSYVISAIQDINEYSTEYFLEKIFQLEIHLPYYSITSLTKEIEVLLVRGRNNEIYCQQIRELLSGNIPQIWFLYLTTLRDVKRFVNSFTLHYDLLKPDVEISDLFYVEILRIKYPKVYELLYRRTWEFLTFVEDGNNGKIIWLRFLWRDQDGEGKILKEPRVNWPHGEAKLGISRFLKEHHPELNIPSQQLRLVEQLLLFLFPDDKNFDNRSTQSIQCYDSYFRYFAYRLLEEDISEQEFQNYVGGKWELFRDRIERWINDNNGANISTLYTLLRRRSDFSSKQEFENVLRAIFFIIRFKRINNYSEEAFILTYGYTDIIEKLFSRNRSQQVYNGNNEECYKFLLEVLGEGMLQDEKRVIQSYIFEGRLLRHLMQYLYCVKGDVQYDQVEIAAVYRSNMETTEIAAHLDAQKLLGFAIGNLTTYLGKVDTWGKDIETLMWSCITGSSNDDANGSSVMELSSTSDMISTKIRTPVLLFIQQDIDIFLLALLQRRRMDVESLYFNLNKSTILALWDSWDDFKKFLSNQANSNSNYIKDFLQFFSKFQHASYQAIKFEFKEIPIEQIGEGHW